MSYDRSTTCIPAYQLLEFMRKCERNTLNGTRKKRRNLSVCLWHTTKIATYVLYARQSTINFSVSNTNISTVDNRLFDRTQFRHLDDRIGNVRQSQPHNGYYNCRAWSYCLRDTVTRVNAASQPARQSAAVGPHNKWTKRAPSPYVERAHKWRTRSVAQWSRTQRTVIVVIIYIYFLAAGVGVRERLAQTSSQAVNPPLTPWFTVTVIRLRSRMIKPFYRILWNQFAFLKTHEYPQTRIKCLEEKNTDILEYFARR